MRTLDKLGGYPEIHDSHELQENMTLDKFRGTHTFWIFIGTCGNSGYRDLRDFHEILEKQHMGQILVYPHIRDFHESGGQWVIGKFRGSPDFFRFS